MKSLLLLAGAFALSISAAQAQTVLPSGAVAPAGAVTPAGAAITPGTVPGAQPAANLSADDAGSPRARHHEKIPGLSHQDRKELRKLSKVRAMPTEDGKIKKQ